MNRNSDIQHTAEDKTSSLQRGIQLQVQINISHSGFTAIL